MQKKTRLLAGAALGAILTLGAGGAQARSSADDAAIAAELKALREQVQVLTERLNAQEAAQRQAQAQAAQAQAVAQAAQARADAQIEQIPTQVQAQVAQSLPKPKASWADATTVSGRMYYNLSHVEAKRDGTKLAASGTGFDLKRFYVGVDHKFSDTFAGNLTTDVAYNASEGLTQVYIKKAYLQAKVSDAMTVRLGSADLPWVPFAEDLYGYRFIENTLIDRDKFGTSADWGVHAFGKLADGKVSYAVSAINGAGYKNPVKTKTVDLEGRVSTTLGAVTLGVGGYTGKLGKDIEGGRTYHTANRFNAIAAYKADRFRVGAEYFAASNWNNVATLASDSSDGYSVFGAFNVSDKVSVFGRYDWVNPSKDLKPDVEDGYFNIGVNFEPVKIVDLALVYKRDQVDAGLLGTSNGTIGGARKGTYDEIGLFGQFRW